MNKDFIVTMNFAFKYGYHDPKNKEHRLKAYQEFGKFAEDKLKSMGMESKIPNGLNGVWWDEVKQFVEPGIIDWSWTKKLATL